MIKIDITTTATARPGVFRRTMESFIMFMFNLGVSADYRLILNIDPAGGNQTQAERVKSIAQSLFLDPVINVPETANFARAFKWTWDHIREDADFVFHLEDDWELLHRVDVCKLIEILESHRDLLLLRLNAFPSSEVQTKNWNLILPWNGEYFEVTDRNKGTVGFCGHPSLIKAGFVRFARTFLDGVHNPEKQLKGSTSPYLRSVFTSSELGVYSTPGAGPLIRDLGRSWRIKNKVTKKGPAAFFTEWIRG